jgi:hypothetical protein
MIMFNTPTSHSRNGKLVLSALISLVAAVLFLARPIFAQTTSTPPSPNAQGINESNGNNNDFDDDVKQGKDELKKDAEAQKLQKDVIDGEDEQAGDEGDQDIHEHADLEETDQQEGIDESEQDFSSSEIDEVDDADNLDQQSQDVINQNQQEQQHSQEGGSTDVNNE